MQRFLSVTSWRGEGGRDSKDFRLVTTVALPVICFVTVPPFADDLRPNVSPCAGATPREFRLVATVTPPAAVATVILPVVRTGEAGSSRCLRMGVVLWRGAVGEGLPLGEEQPFCDETGSSRCLRMGAALPTPSDLGSIFRCLPALPEGEGLGEAP